MREAEGGFCCLLFTEIQFDEHLLLSMMRKAPLSVFSSDCCRPQGNRWLGAHQMGNNSGDYLLYLLEVIDESLTIM